MVLSSIDQAIEDIRQGRMVIVVDDEDRENEGDLVCAAEKITPEIINFMRKQGGGLICLPLTEQRCDDLQLPPQTSENTSSFGTAFTISIEARRGVTTGISASDRATTILTAVDPRTKPADLARPGHIFPLRAREGGVLVRPGQTEASVDLARLAGLTPAGVICEIMREDGNMARLPDLEIFAETHGLKIISVADLIKYRMQKEICVRRVAEATVPTIYGDFRAIAFENQLNREVHLVMIKGDTNPDSETLVRVHTQCVLGDVFGGLVDDAGWQLQRSLKIISASENGVILYLNLQGRSRDIVRHLEIYGQGTCEAKGFNDAHGSTRDYGIGAQILHEIGLRRIRLLTNHPKKLTALEGFDIEITGFEPLVVQEMAGIESGTDI